MSKTKKKIPGLMCLSRCTGERNVCPSVKAQAVQSFKVTEGKTECIGTDTNK